nr:reverse transcriptase domain-containing protein [Tanacetum cinerariifolium]
MTLSFSRSQTNTYEVKGRLVVNNDFYHNPFIFKESDKYVRDLVASIFVARIRDYGMPDGIKVPTNLSTYDGTTDPNDHLTVFMGTIDVHKLPKPKWVHLAVLLFAVLGCEMNKPPEYMPPWSGCLYVVIIVDVGEMTFLLKDTTEVTLETKNFHVVGYRVGSIRRIQNLEYDVLGFLGVGTTFDIFQNILFPYRLNKAYCLLLGYGVLDLVSFVVFGECRHKYAISSLMDTTYWLS